MRCTTYLKRCAVCAIYHSLTPGIKFDWGRDLEMMREPWLVREGKKSVILTLNTFVLVPTRWDFE